MEKRTYLGFGRSLSVACHITFELNQITGLILFLLLRSQNQRGHHHGTRGNKFTYFTIGPATARVGRHSLVSNNSTPRITLGYRCSIDWLRWPSTSKRGSNKLDDNGDNGGKRVPGDRAGHSECGSGKKRKKNR